MLTSGRGMGTDILLQGRRRRRWKGEENQPSQGAVEALRRRVLGHLHLLVARVVRALLCARSSRRGRTHRARQGNRPSNWYAGIAVDSFSVCAWAVGEKASESYSIYAWAVDDCQIGIHVNGTGEKVGTFALAYAAHKALSPVRFPPTVALTPIVAAWFGKKPDSQ